MSESANSVIQSARDTLSVAVNALVFSFRFIGANFGVVVRGVAIPGLLGCAVLYLLMWSYCAQLVDFLGHPSEGQAGKVMGIAAAGLLLLLLLDAVVASRLAELLTGERCREPAFLGIGTDAWRLYAVNLRLLLALGVYGVVTMGTSDLMVYLSIAPGIEMLFIISAWLFLFWLAARGWFLVLPVSRQIGDDGVLGASWRRSCGHFVTIGLILLVLMMLTMLLLGLGEYILRSVGLMSQLPAAVSFIDAIAFYQRNMLPSVILVSLVYLCITGLMTATRIRLHQDMAIASST